MDYTVFWWLLRQFAFLTLTMNLAYCEVKKMGIMFCNTTQVIKHVYCVHVAKSHKQQKSTGTAWRSPRWDP